MNGIDSKTSLTSLHPRQLSKARTLDRDTQVGQRIRGLREARHLTLGALSSELGVTYQQLQKYEKGVNRIGAGRLWELAEALGVPVSALFSDEADGSSCDDWGDASNSAEARELVTLFSRIRGRKRRLMAIDAMRRLASDGIGKR